MPWGALRKNSQAFHANAYAETFAADLSSQASATSAAQGVDTIIYSIGVPYTEFRLHPQLMKTTLEAAVAAKVARIVVVSNVYSYGAPQTQHVAETHPRSPQTFKGQMRKQQEDLALAAHQQGKLKSLILRLPDFYGPHADNSLANPIFQAAIAGKSADWLGSVDLPHEFIYVPDAGPVLVNLAACEDCYGQIWNLAGTGTITGREFITSIYRSVNREPKWRTASKFVLRAAGLFNPLLRELVEMFYLNETPVILDDSKLRTYLGDIQKTDYTDGIYKTLAWIRQPES